MSARISERRLVDVLVNYLRERQPVVRELRHYEKSIDLASVCTESGEVWAIEAKTTNWPEAVAQAFVNLAAADRSYIAIYDKHVHRVDFGLLEQLGLGLISVGTHWGDVKVVRTADRSPYTNRIVAERYRSAIASGRA